ncbi:MAG TPA: 23S rRNA (adenine(2503)-C(2))-methyltransferase RlmN [Opitutaceae bacterium]|nr:23S rRNA (adenine(2503)-C(2))-methyltransferase RlmN [Opitutaceae bacterium]HRJ47289.1 23S rRNA (adenine(2503)-C(2))-methyltransferase RlmN [Opitutaceae bacterium]
MSAASVPVSLHDLTRAELGALFARWEFSPVHVARLWRYLYWECVASLAEMPELPAKVRRRLADETRLHTPGIALETDSSDGFTRKYLLRLEDHERIETVLMRYTGRVTACISSQVGCAMGCVFCATGQMGYTRHLTPGEIVAQAVHVQRVLRAQGQRLRNIVLMGMGEPLHNYDAVMQAMEILRDPNGLALGAERITLSTVGVVPGILRLAREKRPLRLAVSLHAATQPERAALVPAAKKWPLDELMAACRTYSETTGRRIFYEWTLIEGKNDRPGDARAVGRLLQGLPAQVNLIPLNPTAGFAGAPTRTEASHRFQRILAEEFKIPSTVRQRRGIDIAAGCGQLAVAEKN